MSSLKTTDATQQPSKKDLFGPQTDLAGMPVGGAASQTAEKKEKTKRELMWEQRLQEKRGLANPPAPQGASLIDQMNPRSRGPITSPGPQKGPQVVSPVQAPEGFQKATAFNNPQSLIQIPSVAPGQVQVPSQPIAQIERPQPPKAPVPLEPSQSFQGVNTVAPPKQQQAPAPVPRQAPAPAEPVQTRKGGVWDQIQQSKGQAASFSQAPQPKPIPQHPQFQKAQVISQAIVASDVNPVTQPDPPRAPQSNEFSDFYRAPPAQAQVDSFTVQEPPRDFHQGLRDDQRPAGPSSMEPRAQREAAPMTQVQPFPQLKQPAHFAPPKPVAQATQSAPPSHLNDDFFKAPQRNGAPDPMAQMGQAPSPAPPQSISVPTPVQAAEPYQPERQPSSFSFPSEQPQRKPQAMQMAPPPQIANEREDAIRNYQAKIGQSGMAIIEERQMQAQKNADFLSEWKQQIELKEQRKKLEKQRLRQLELKELQEQMNYDPFGKGGAGAPNKPVSPSKARSPPIANQQDFGRPGGQGSMEEDYRSAPQQTLHVSASQEKLGVHHQTPLNQGQFVIGQEAKARELAEGDKKRQLQMELQRQMEEAKAKKEAQQRRQKEEEDREEQRLRKERQQLEEAFRREEESKKKKAEDLKQENLQMMEQRNAKKVEVQEPENFVVSKKKPQRNADPPTDDPFMSGPRQGGSEVGGAMPPPPQATGQWQAASEFQASQPIAAAGPPMPQGTNMTFQPPPPGFDQSMPLPQQQQQQPFGMMPQANPFMAMGGFGMPGFPMQQPMSQAQLDQAKIIKDISEALQSNFKEEIGKLKDRMEEQQSAFTKQLIELQSETQNALQRKREAERELQKVKTELGGDSQPPQQLSGSFGLANPASYGHANPVSYGADERPIRPMQGGAGGVQGMASQPSFSKADERPIRPMGGQAQGSYGDSAFGQTAFGQPDAMQRTDGSQRTRWQKPQAPQPAAEYAYDMDGRPASNFNPQRPPSSSSRHAAREEDRQQFRRSQNSNIEKMFFSSSRGMSAAKGEGKQTAAFKRPPSGATSYQSARDAHSKSYNKPKEAQVVNFGSSPGRDEESVLLESARKELDEGFQRSRAKLPPSEETFGASRPPKNTTSLRNRRQSSNLKGDSSLMPVGKAPQQDELEVIKNLAQGVIKNLHEQQVMGTLTDETRENFKRQKGGISFEVGDQPTDIGGNAAQPIDTNYPSFEFPSLNNTSMARKPPVPAGPRRPMPPTENKFRDLADPNMTTRSLMSVNSVNLDKINQRNAERLARLENSDFQDSVVHESSFKVADRSINASGSMAQDAGHRGTDLEQLDGMLADILRKDSARRP